MEDSTVMSLSAFVYTPPDDKIVSLRENQMTVAETESRAASLKEMRNKVDNLSYWIAEFKEEGEDSESMETEREFWSKCIAFNS